MALLTNWLRTGRAWSVSASWFPLLLLALLWILAAWCHLHLFPDAIPSMLWPFFAFGSAAYLLTLAGFVFFCNPESPVDGSTRIATALAIGIAMIFGVYAWSQWPKGTDLPTNTISKPSNGTKLSSQVLSSTSQTTANGTSAVPTQLNAAKHSSVPDQSTSNCVSVMFTPPNEAKSDNGDSLNLVNVFAAILGVVLAAVALIAQKSAVDAKAEAEKARKDILEALDIKILALSSRLLAYAQAAKSEAQELSSESYDIGNQDQYLARFLSRRSTSLGRLAKFFMLLHHWILDPRLVPTADLAGYVAILALDLPVLETNQNTFDREQRLRIEYWQPAGQLIENLLILGSPSSAISTEAEKVMLKLQEVRAMLAKL